MTRAEEAAKKAYPNGLYIPDLQRAFRQGYRQAQKDLAEWHDPDCPPEHGGRYLCKTRNSYYVLWYRERRGAFCDEQANSYNILGWREIHE